jgi:salicylate biosynthesis isochorismate synthase
VSPSAVFERARAEARRAASDAVVIATLRAPVAPRSHGAPRVVWEPAAGPSIVGWGEALRVDASGVERFGRTRDDGAAAFARLVEVRDEGAAPAPRPRLFGGFAFTTADGRRGEPWQAFGDASFTLPAVVFASEQGLTWLSLALPAAEAAQGGAFERAATAALALAETEPLCAPRAASIEWPARGPWTRAIEEALTRIDDRTFQKVVAATVCQVASDERPSLERALARLRERYPSSTRFAFERGASIFFGASPETLVDVSGGFAVADALAGTIPRGDDDAATRSALLASDKDRREHAAVVDAVRAALGAADDRRDADPEVLVLRNVMHLRTVLRVAVAPATHVVDLVARLHPTPAVAGAPREAALAWLAEREPMGRGWYAGAVGWFDAQGEGSFRVAIRSGVVAGSRAWLYAGAGIVRGSDPAREYAEVRAKLAPMLEALEATP